MFDLLFYLYILRLWINISTLLMKLLYHILGLTTKLGRAAWSQGNDAQLCVVTIQISKLVC